MKIEILDLARDDLINGFHIYNDQNPGIGEYFLTNIYVFPVKLIPFLSLRSSIYQFIQDILSKFLVQ